MRWTGSLCPAFKGRHIAINGKCVRGSRFEVGSAPWRTLLFLRGCCTAKRWTLCATGAHYNAFAGEKGPDIMPITRTRRARAKRSG